MIKKYLLPLAVIISLSGCTAAKTVMKKRELNVESHVSSSITLEPLAPEERVVYVRVKDLSGNSMRRDMMEKIKNTLELEGVRITNNPKEANLMLNASIVSAKNTSEEEKNTFLNSGYAGGAEGLLGAAALASTMSDHTRSIAGVGLAGAAVGFLADTMIEDTYYTFVMDVELRERPLEGDSIENAKKSQSARGFTSKNTRATTRANSNVTRGDNYNWIVYETRIISVANQMNLKIENAIPAVQEKTSDTLVEFLL